MATRTRKTQTSPAAPAAAPADAALTAVYAALAVAGLSPAVAEHVIDAVERYGDARADDVWALTLR